jgi:hypothetical protein
LQAGVTDHFVLSSQGWTQVETSETSQGSPLPFDDILFFATQKTLMLARVSIISREVFKDVACNSQQRGQDTCLSQCATRMHEKLIMTKAKHYSEVMEALCAEVPTNIATRHDTQTSGNANVVSHTLPKVQCT